MGSTIKEWLLSLYNEELKEETGTIENERIWAKGATGEERAMHRANIELHKEYVTVLKQLISNLREQE